MAFVYEVSRPPLFNPKKATAEIGPGQYIPLTLYKFEKPNIVPFNASSKEEIYSEYIQIQVLVLIIQKKNKIYLIK